MMEREESEIVEVYAAADLAEAHFLRNLLSEAGIEARVVGDTLESMLPPGNDVAPRLWVFRQDEPRARELLGEYERVHAQPHGELEPEVPAPGWKCPSCGETVEPDFEVCWSCETPRPSA